MYVGPTTTSYWYRYWVVLFLSVTEELEVLRNIGNSKLDTGRESSRNRSTQIDILDIGDGLCGYGREPLLWPSC